MLTPIALIVGVLVTYRLAILFTTDSIFNGVREFIWRRFPGDMFFYEDSKVSEYQALDGHRFGRVNAFPFRREVTFINGFWRPDKTYKVAELVECFYCASIWVAAGITVLYTAYKGLPYTVETFLYFGAIAGGAEVVNNKLGRE